MPTLKKGDFTVTETIPAVVTQLKAQGFREVIATPEPVEVPAIQAEEVEAEAPKKRTRTPKDETEAK